MRAPSRVLVGHWCLLWSTAPPLLPLRCYYRRGGCSGIVELPRPPAAEGRMIRHWITLMLLVLLVLIQTACPKYFTQQTKDLQGIPRQWYCPTLAILGLVEGQRTALHIHI